MAEVIFARRQSPDWQMIADHYVQGKPVDSDWYVPPVHIPGFPPDIEGLIGKWNSTFSVDFFTFRAVVAALSEANINAIPHSLALAYDDPRLLEEMARNPAAFVYFHDDDDFFAPDIASILARHAITADAVVSPLFRVGSDTFTFAKPDVGSDFVWGRAEGFHMVFQSNNYGLRASSFADPAAILQYKDHVEASRAISGSGLTIHDITTPISATVKTPASASVLKSVVGPKAYWLRKLGLSGLRPDLLGGFIADSSTAGVPQEYGWIVEPLDEIRAMMQAIVARLPYAGKA